MMATDLVCLCEIGGDDLERVTFRHGSGIVLQLTDDSMSLLLDICPRLQQMFEVHIFHPRTDHTVSLVHTRNVQSRLEPVGWIVECQVLFGPYSSTQERMCTLHEFFQPSRPGPLDCIDRWGGSC